MKIAITTVGTRGDLQPYIALGLGLKKAGHEVQIVSAKNEEAFVRHYGLDFYALDVDIQQIMEQDEVQEMAKGNNPIKFILSHLKSSKTLKALMIKTQGEIWAACKDTDLIIFHPGMPIGFFFAKLHGRKSVLANPFPVIATKDYPSILFYSLPRLGKMYNLLTHFIFEKVFWAMSKSAIMTFWNENIHAKMDFKTSPIRQQLLGGNTILNGYSELLFQHSEYWGGHIHTTGSWLIDEEPNFVPPQELHNFIQAGEAPIYIGFGSMQDTHTFKNTLEIIAEALKTTNQRAVVGLGWSKNNYQGAIPANIFLIESIPHSWLFPLMKMVVHHGGAGTTAAGLRAGKPTVIIPHNADQPAWGKRVFELGVGSKPIKKTKLTAEALAEAIQFSLQTNIIENAKLLGQKMQAENGVEKAVAIINQIR